MPYLGWHFISTNLFVVSYTMNEVGGRVHFEDPNVRKLLFHALLFLHAKDRSHFILFDGKYLLIDFMARFWQSELQEGIIKDILSLVRSLYDGAQFPDLVILNQYGKSPSAELINGIFNICETQIGFKKNISIMFLLRVSKTSCK
jgi:hypothetical protein